MIYYDLFKGDPFLFSRNGSTLIGDRERDGATFPIRPERDARRRFTFPPERRKVIQTTSWSLKTVSFRRTCSHFCAKLLARRRHCGATRKRPKFACRHLRLAADGRAMYKLKSARYRCDYIYQPRV
ncbi:hypothetical protein EVAR_23099_1 [Eumeta japonica]|uniref:Uncharacterized protein n=1 Tax=Eumeta variegata TaxID=151549 RepID=A0A4C1VM81_EUMVA|nr:hypothetical protein EVAR_23099_1 [Eumeta japonica]